MTNRAAYLELEAFTDLGWDGISRRRAAANGRTLQHLLSTAFLLWDVFAHVMHDASTREPCFDLFFRTPEHEQNSKPSALPEIVACESPGSL